MFTLAPLLVHSEAVPSSARAALRAALASGGSERTEMLAMAARILHAESGLDCTDIRELVGLTAESTCG